MSVEKSVTKKKIFIVRGISVIIILIVVAIAAYFVINKAKSIVTSVQMDPPAYVSLVEHDNFLAPVDGVIQEDDLKSYLKISKEIKAIISEKFKDGQFKINWENNQNYLNLVAKLYDIREIQAKVLKENRYSVKKYKWMTRQLVLIFGGELVKQMNMLIKVRGSDQTEINSSKEVSDIPQQNLDLFDKYENEITEVIGLWVLGI